MYAHFWKRFFDFWIALTAILILSPVLVLLTLLGAIAMRGNPFFVQKRPGKGEKIFRLLKFRTMTNRRDREGKLLSDDARLTRYGRFLRATSLDELPQLLNILVGHMAIVGPRPLLPEYLPYYAEAEKRRHTVRPGLTGWAQVNGRSVTGWDERLQQDVDYVDRCSFGFDCKILLLTVKKVLKRSDILVGAQHGSGHGRLDVVRRAQREQDGDEQMSAQHSMRG